MTTAPAGWYPDPEQPRSRRYWDGTRWEEAPQRGSGLVGAAYACAVLLPLVGFILGIVVAAKEGKAGPLILSVLMMFFVLLVLGAI